MLFSFRPCLRIRIGLIFRCNKVRIKGVFGIIRWISKCNGKTCFAIAEREAFGRKPTELDSPQTRVGLGFGVKTGCQFTKTHCSGLAQSHYEEQYKLNVDKIDFFSKKWANVSENWLFLLRENGLHLSKVQTSLTLHSVCTIFAFVIDIHSEIFVVKNFC